MSPDCDMAGNFPPEGLHEDAQDEVHGFEEVLHRPDSSND